MSDTGRRRHGLESFLSADARRADGSAPVRATVVDDAGYVNLRGPATNDAFAAAVTSALGQSLPSRPNTSTVGDCRVCWFGPSEWLIATSIGDAPRTTAALEAAVDRHGGAVNDVSAGYVTMRLQGEAVPDVLAAGCTLDLAALSQRPDSAVQCGLAKASVLLVTADDAGDLRIVVRRSFADYLAHWLDHVGERHGLAWTV